MPWSNDQLNELYIYDPITGELILSVTADGFVYVVGDARYEITESGLSARLLPDNGSFISLVPRDTYDGTRLIMQPPDHDGVTWPFPGFLGTTQQERSPGVWVPETYLASPSSLDDPATSAQLLLQGRDTAGSTDVVQFRTAQILSLPNQQMSYGCLDTYVGTSTGGSSSTTFFIVDWCLTAWYGTGMLSTRIYDVAFAGTLRSSVVNDRAGLRLYHNTSASLTGATLITDLGQTRIDVAAVDQPFSVVGELVGVPTATHIILAVNRAAGGGNVSATANYRKLCDIGPV